MDKVKQFGKRLSQVRSKNQGADAKWEDFLSKLAQVHEANPDNLCAKHLTKDLFLSYKPQEREILYKCCLTGVENPDSSLGAYAMTPKDYTTFKKFFDPLIREYHGAKADAKHVTDWNASGIGKNGVLDLAELGLSEVSMRVRVGRNLTQFNLPGNMTKEERIKFEQTMLAAFSKLIAMKEYGGRVYSLTPNFGKKPNPNLITDAQYQDLVDRHIMFKDMDADPFLKSAGISNDWPYGRGCYVSADEQFIIWFGEEDQLRIMCMMKGTKLNEVFDRLRKGLEVVESINGIKFATSEDYGYVTSCPSNLGTGMRASVHIKLPNLTKDGTDTKAKAVAKPLGLSVRGIGGEHTPIGADGTVDISPRARLFIREKDIIAKLYEGIKLLMEEEKKAGGGKASASSGQSTEFESFLKALEAVHKENPDNLAAKHLTRKLFLSFPPEKQKILYKCALTGVENPTSSIGAYAMTPTDYTVFKAFFDPLIREYHGASPTAKHVTDWDISNIGNKGVLDVSELGLDALSMRVRVGRNLKQFNLPGNMTKSERIKFEKTMLKAFAKLIAMEEYGGQVYSLTPDFEGEKNPNLITDKEYQELVDRHIMFKNMDDDPFLKSAGISNDWPYGRGCYVSADNQFIVWFGEEDQLRIMCMKVGTKLNEVFGRLREGLDTIESIDGIDFATSEDYGYVTSCPSNLGTGMRASVHVKLPNLTKDGTDTKAKAVAKPLGLSVRGIGGEHTPIGADGTVDISPRARLFIREKDIIVSLYEGIKLLMAEEKKA